MSSGGSAVISIHTARFALLQDAIHQLLGPLAVAIVRTLCERGPLTLKEISDVALSDCYQPRTTFIAAAREVRSSLSVGADSNIDKLSEPAVITDAAVKELVARLLLHRVIAYDAAESTYSILLGYGILLHVLYPLLAQAARTRYGEAGEVLFVTMRQLAVLPWATAKRVASDRRPVLAEAIEQAASRMEADGWIELVQQPIDASSAAVGLKRGREEDSAHPLPASSGVCRLNIDTLLRELLHDAILQWVAEHFSDGGLAVAVMSVFIRSTRNASRSDSSNRPLGFPPSFSGVSSPHLSAHTVRSSIARNFVHVPLEAIQQVLHRLSTLSLHGGVLGGFVLTREDGGTTYCLRATCVIQALQLSACERVVFTRHGVLGVRILKLLIRHHLLEDKNIAEEVIATQPKTRETLHAMMKDGYVYQQEVPRSGAMADRLPKNSVFLWGCSLDKSVTPVVQEQVAKALHHALLKLRDVVQQNKQSASVVHSQQQQHRGSSMLGDSRMAALHAMAPELSDYINGNKNSAHSGAADEKANPEVIRRAVRAQRNVIGLESCALSLMRSSLLLDFY